MALAPRMDNVTAGAALEFGQWAARLAFGLQSRLGWLPGEAGNDAELLFRGC